MNKMIIVVLLFVLLLTSNLTAQETTYPILYPKGGSLHLKECSTEIDCSFSGTQTVFGKYYFGFSEICDNGEKDGCVTLDFYPDDVTVLPYFKGSKLTFVNIRNYKEGAEKLIGKALVKRVISAARSTIAATLPGHDFGKVIAVEGRATVLIGEYDMGICCDSFYANAKILQVKKRSKAKITNAGGSNFLERIAHIASSR